jgi:hypothetical protein
VAQVLSEFHRQRRELGDSGKFSAAGLAEAIAELAAQVAGQVKRITDDSHVLNNLRQTEAQLAPKAVDPVERLYALWQQMEIRQLLASQGIADDEARARLFYLEALERGDHLAMLALEEWPLGSPVRDTELIERGKQARQEARDPVAAKKLGELKTFHSTLAQLTRHALKELPTIELDPLAQMAAG